jgi:hypothetical protein
MSSKSFCLFPSRILGRGSGRISRACNISGKLNEPHIHTKNRARMTEDFSIRDLSFNVQTARVCFRSGPTCEVTGEWRKLHNEELNDLYSLPNIVRVVKSRRIR